MAAVFLTIPYAWTGKSTIDDVEGVRISYSVILGSSS